MKAHITKQGIKTTNITNMDESTLWLARRKAIAAVSRQCWRPRAPTRMMLRK